MLLGTKKGKKSMRSRISLLFLVVTVLLVSSLQDKPYALAQVEPGAPCEQFSDKPWCDPTLAPNERAGLLLQAMTNTEKFQLMQGDTDDAHTGANSGIERLGIPTVHFTDGPAGVRAGSVLESKPGTALPAPISLAATWNREMANQHGSLVGIEAKLRGNDVVFGPNVNIMRTPKGARTYEAYGEDPFLTSNIGVAWIQGLQDKGVMGNVKHFVANNQETNRSTVNAVVSERTLREIYLPGFESAVKDARVGSAMLSYNRVNGQYMTENCSLVNATLKQGFQFDGFTVTDYGAQKSTVEAANCGTDIEFLTDFYNPILLSTAVASGKISQATINDHARRYLRTLFKFGVFDRAAYPENGTIDIEAHGKTARNIADQSITLLKNKEKLLPLDVNGLSKIAVIGDAADQYVNGKGSSNVNPNYVVTPLEGILQRVGDNAEVVYDDGSDLERVAEVVKNVDVAIVIAADTFGHGADKVCLSLSSPCTTDYGEQDSLIEQVAATNKNTVVVLETGGPVLMPWINQVPAVVEAWYSGQEGGDAIAAVLFGDVNPSGKLPATFPVSEDDLAVAGNLEQYPGVAENAHYSEGVFMGYRHYDENGIEPLFAFGHGLSYTNFDYSNLKIKRDPVSRHTEVTVKVKNTGARAGAEVVQLYVGMPDPSADVQQPPKWLKGFEKIELESGQTKQVTFELGPRSFSYWNEASQSWTIADGIYNIMVGSSSRDIRVEETITINN
ncbi:glycoside hydrolase family 3 C-terminal domain-containing protein [Halalkalibacter urbisdiaboli]|uniref:glycoside hydrolase family 3 C-terminal domain-containing protein n=1 Tax=Halalkalibacter urbisdiaboli TaxID=1960589 RepID=UPI000B4388F7|nr:glycoside hydrolase family 3 C-terminal domain-containing protein [Halalkalibacter urbisdiaboli]